MLNCKVCIVGNNFQLQREILYSWLGTTNTNKEFVGVEVFPVVYDNVCFNVWNIDCPSNTSFLKGMLDNSKAVIFVIEDTLDSKLMRNIRELFQGPILVAGFGELSQQAYNRWLSVSPHTENTHFLSCSDTSMQDKDALRCVLECLGKNTLVSY